MKSLKGILLRVLLVSAAAAPVVWHVHRLMVRQAATAAFAGHIDGYLNEYRKEMPSGEIDPSPPNAIHGRLVVVNSDTRQLDSAFFDLPDDLRASGPESARIVVVTGYQESKVGRYGNIPFASGIAYDCYGHYEFIDLAQHKFVGRFQFTYSPPSRVDNTSSFFDHHAPHPTRDFLHHLAQLPRQ